MSSTKERMLNLAVCRLTDYDREQYFALQRLGGKDLGNEYERKRIIYFVIATYFPDLARDGKTCREVLLSLESDMLKAYREIMSDEDFYAQVRGIFGDKPRA